MRFIALDAVFSRFFYNWRLFIYSLIDLKIFIPILKFQEITDCLTNTSPNTNDERAWHKFLPFNLFMRERLVKLLKIAFIA